MPGSRLPPPGGPPTARCPECGYELDWDQDECPQCGTILNDVEVEDLEE